MKIAALLAVVVSLPKAAAGADMQATCPTFLPNDSVTVRAPPGWSGSSQPIFRLAGANMMAGPLESHADLVPDQQKRIKSGRETTYVFDDGEKWYRCVYGSGGLQISKRLDDSAKRCIVRFTSIGLPTVTSAAVVCTAEKTVP